MKSDVEISEKLSRFQWLWRKKKHRQYAANGTVLDSSCGQGRIIALLKSCGGMSMKDMTHILGVNYSSLSEQLLKLENSGYIQREVLPNDKRVVIAKLTEQGENTEQHTLLTDSNNFAVLSAEEQETFCDYLDRLNVSLQSELGLNEDEVLAEIEERRQRRLQKRLERQYSEQVDKNIGKKIEHGKSPFFI